MRRLSDLDELPASEDAAQEPPVAPVVVTATTSEPVHVTAQPAEAALKPAPNPSFFKSKTIKGQVYDLSHLNPFQFSLEGMEGTYTIEVIFSCHCFTEAVGNQHTPDFHYTHKGEKRAFCISRHGLSIALPSMITSLGKQSVYWNNRGNFFFWRNQAITGTNIPYLVFFDTIRSRGKNGVDVVMNVESAHLKPNMTQSAAPIKFANLIEAKATGKAIKPGPRVSIKRK